MLLSVQMSGVLLYSCAKIEAMSCGMCRGAWVLPLPRPCMPCVAVQWVREHSAGAGLCRKSSWLRIQCCALCTEFFLLWIQQQLLLTTSLGKDTFHFYLLLSLTFQKSRTMETDAESHCPRNESGRQWEGGQSIFLSSYMQHKRESVFILSFLQGASPSY